MARNPAFTPFVRPIGQFTSAFNAARNALFQPPRTTIDSLNNTGLWPDPLQPVTPLQPTGAEPLQWPFEWGRNVDYTPRGDAEWSADDLRKLGTYPLARVCIENSKDMIVRMPHRIQLKPLQGETSKARAERSKGDKDLKMLNEFFDQPNPMEEWQSWLRPILEDMLVVDAASIFVGRTSKGKVAELWWVEGSGITRLVEEHGRTPAPPNPAYQQLWQGWPRVDLTTLQLIYRPRNIVPRGTQSSRLYGMCYDDKTEVLTRRGWLLFKDVVIADELATRNCDTKKFEWQLPSMLIDEEYSGDMYACQSKTVDLMVTPQHRMLISRPTYNYRIKNEIIQTAEELFTSTEKGRSIRHGEPKIPMTSEWDGVPVETKVFSTESVVEELEEVVIGASNSEIVNKRTFPTYAGKATVMSGDEFCAFMGMYLSEGWSGEGIAQTNESKGFKPFKELLNSIFDHDVYYDGSSFIFSRKYITQYLKQFGKSYEKFVPEEIMNSTKEQLKLFWDYYVLGDGCIENYTSKTARGTSPKQSVSITTTSKQMADQLVEIAQKLGWSASMGFEAGGIFDLRFDDSGRLSVCRDSYYVNVRYSKHMSFSMDKVHYDGRIYCATVPNGILYVRRNGKPAWSGNSPTEQMAPEIRIGMERLRFVYDFYSSGSIPGGMHFVPPNTPPDKIREAQQYLDATYGGNLARRRQLQLVQGWQTDGHAEQLSFPHEPALADLFDEVHTRKICFAFGTSPQRLMRQMNRASAATAQTAAEEEGTLPWMDWLKSVIDHIIQRVLGYPEYEFAFDPFHEMDIVKQSQADANDIKNGLYTRNEKREMRGDDPRPEPEADELSVMTAQGAIPLGQIVKPAGGGGAQDSGTSTATTTKTNGHTVFATCRKHAGQYPRSHCEDCIRAEQKMQRPGPLVPIPPQVRMLDTSRF